MQIYSGPVHVDYNEAMLLTGDDEAPDSEGPFAGQINGMCGAAESGSLHFMTASRVASVNFVLEVLATEPDLSDDYDDVVEVSFDALGEQARLCGFWGVIACEFELPAASYRVRYSGRNLDAASALEYENEDDEYVAVDEFLVQLWPATPAADVVIRETSEVARSFRIRNGTPTADESARIAAGHDLWTPASARAMHEGLKWLLTQAAQARGISDDSSFQRAMTVADQLFKRYQADVDSYPDAYCEQLQRDALGSLDGPVRRAEAAVDQSPEGSPEYDTALRTAHAWNAMWNRLFGIDSPDAFSAFGPSTVAYLATSALGSEGPAAEAEFLRRIKLA